jgi:Na+-transporting methylmalonyl-CoA/oxaloacetate decarboxylase beta subunit
VVGAAGPSPARIAVKVVSALDSGGEAGEAVVVSAMGGSEGTGVIAAAAGTSACLPS